MAKFRIKTFNKISDKGLSRFTDDYDISPDHEEYDAIILRSQKLHDEKFSSNLLAIARAGAGYNNVPVDRCTEAGIVAYNTPGANANGVKELVLAGMLMSARNIHEALPFSQTLDGKGDEVPQLVEAGKKAFVGPEIMGKKLGVIGLGAIGGKVANSAIMLGMSVEGFDPYLSEEFKALLDTDVMVKTDLDDFLADLDYLSIHIPLLESTKNFISAAQFGKMKKGIRVMNFSRGGLVNEDDLEAAISEGVVKHYVTDFPNQRILGMKNVINIPHLGASTPESEENCAKMAADQLRELLEDGNIRNSVNFPNLCVEKNGPRVIAALKGEGDLEGVIKEWMSANGIQGLLKGSAKRGEISFAIVDLASPAADDSVSKLSETAGVLWARSYK